MPGSRALFYRPPFVSWVGHLSFVLRSLPLRSLRSLRETNGGYEWRTEDGTKTRQRRYEVKGTWGDDTRWTESVTPGPWSSGVVSSPHTVPFRFTVVSVPIRSLTTFLSLTSPYSERSDWNGVGRSWVRGPGSRPEVMRERKGPWSERRAASRHLRGSARAAHCPLPPPHLTSRLSPSDVALRAGLRPIRRYGGGMRGESETRA